MELSEAQNLLAGAAREGLPEVAIENLKVGLITRHVLELCFKRWAQITNDGQLIERVGVHARELYFAEWLNTMLEAGRVVWAAQRVEICAKSVQENEK